MDKDFFIDIPTSDPFRDDKLDRRKIGEKLSLMIKSYPTPAVISINAPWGFGKTTFIKMWKKQLSNEGHHCIYFNAWENDFASSPFIAFIAILIQHFREENAANQGLLEAQFKDLASWGYRAIGSQVSSTLKKATGEFIDFEALSKTSKVEQATLERLLGKIGSNEIAEYLSRATFINKFNDHLTKLIESASRCNSALPLIIFIDELDRCRPLYAIELLEVAKHLFSASGVIFVLSMDSSQLAHSIKSIYGTDFDAQGYLRRFIDYNFNLPSPDSAKLIDALFENSGFTNIIDRRSLVDASLPRTTEWLKYLSQLANLSLRDVIQISNALWVLLMIIPLELAKHFHYTVYLVSLGFIKNVEFEKFNDSRGRGIDISRTLLPFANKAVRPNNLINKEIEFHLSRAFTEDVRIIQNLRKLERELSEVSNSSSLSNADSNRKELLESLFKHSQTDVHSKLLELISFVLPTDNDNEGNPHL